MTRIAGLYLVLWCFGMAGCAEPRDPASTPPAEAPSIQTYEGLGVVKSITPSKTFINIDHEAIPGFMDAMTMMFAVRDSSVIEGVAVGDSIRFTLEVSGQSMVEVTDVDVLGVPD